ncbi:MAG TPA: GNAT family N-acetyltransferase [Actinomycetota bacterium]|nr:GNAT family N-acetyltransferase [Actinomycetota bacterium]
MFRLETERLVLRPFILDDLDALAESLADPEVMRYVGEGEAVGKTRTESEHILTELIAEYDRWGYGLWAVTTDGENDGRPIGWCGLIEWELGGVTEVEVAYLFGRPYWGKGYATEAARAVRDYGVGPVGRTRLVSLVYPDNDASLRVVEKLGMRYERDAEFFGKRLLLHSLRAEGGKVVDPAPAPAWESEDRAP